jgi:tetratricopeptide (TPR) repeat protein
VSLASTKSPVIVEDVVTALTGDVASGPDARQALRERMQRATSEFNTRTAEAFARALLESLTQNPDDLRQLEALVILGCAHPDVLAHHRISLHTEAERLIVLLEQAQELERADTVRELLAESATVHQVETPAAKPANAREPGSERRERVELCLRRADECIAAGRKREAIAALQEVMGLEPGRRDVARMIRDLRSSSRRRNWYIGRTLKTLAVLLVVGGAVAFAYLREMDVREQYGQLDRTRSGNEHAVQARLDAIDDFIATHHFWLGMTDALTDKARLEEQLRSLAQQQQKVKFEQKVAVEELALHADAARTRALMYAQKGQFELALVDFREALKSAPANWEYRQRVQADLAAIEAFLARTTTRGETNR